MATRRRAKNRSEERRVGKECRSLCDWSSDVCSSDLDAQARFLEAIISTKAGIIRVVSLYLPNGNPAPGEKYDYKLKWMDRLIAFSRERLKLEEPFILAGDYNVIPTPAD